jgi:hypothetical protein
MHRKAKEFNVKDQLELHRWKDDGGSGERVETHPPGQEPAPAHDGRPGESEIPRRLVHQGIRPHVQRPWRGIPCGWQSKPIHPTRSRRQQEVFLDFDPVCPEWPIAEDED